jgi:putative beta-barrel porin MtrB/PioB
MERIRYLIVWSLSLALFFLLASTARAQIDTGDFIVSGSAEVGGLPRGLSGSDAKFQEYRDIPESVIVPELQLMIGGKKNDFYLSFDAGKVGREDQNYSLRFGRYGLLDVQFEWDQIPHLFDDSTARTPYMMNGGTYTLSSRPNGPYTGTSCGANNVCQWLGAADHPVDLSLLDKIARLKLRYTPSPGWTFTGNYWSNRDTGQRAFGVLNGFSSSTMNISELAEPIDYLTHNVEVGGEYAGQGWSVALKYNGSFFHNNTSTLIWDNPIHAMLGGTTIGSSIFGGSCQDSAVYDPASGIGPCKGRLDLYPNNQAHTITLTGTATIPWTMNTRFLGTVSYGWRLQDDNFLPFTINSCYVPGGGVNPNPATGSCKDANFTALPTISNHSLNGDVRPLMVNTTLVNNSLVTGLNLKAYYRLYDLSNKSNHVTEPTGFIGNDRGTSPTGDQPTQNDINKYSKNSVGFEAGYEITRWLHGKFGYYWDKMHREGFETIDSSENSLGPTFDIKPNSWVLFRASYKHSWRSSDFTNDLSVGNPLLPFYLQRRDQDKASLFADVSPLDTLSFHGGFEYVGNTYPGAHNPATQNSYGLRTGQDYSPSAGFLYAPLEWLKLFGDYNWDFNKWRINMQNSTGVKSHGQDTVNTFSLGSDIDIIKNVLGFRIQYTFSEALSEISNHGGTGPAATDYPNTISTWQELLMRFDYQINKFWSLHTGYYFNALHGKNFGVDIMQQWMGNISSPGDTANQQLSQQRSIFLGDQLGGPYTAHVGLISLKFKF